MPGMMIPALLINGFAVAAVVGFHYEVLRQLSALLHRMTIRVRLRILVGVFGAIAAHFAEVWIFAFVYWLKLGVGGFGTLEGQFNGDLLDCVYFSFVSYTTLGYGDIYATGLLRFLAGVESLVGLVLITWTASFLFVEMSRYWHED